MQAAACRMRPELAPAVTNAASAPSIARDGRARRRVQLVHVHERLRGLAHRLRAPRDAASSRRSASSCPIRESRAARRAVRRCGSAITRAPSSFIARTAAENAVERLLDDLVGVAGATSARAPLKSTPCRMSACRSARLRVGILRVEASPVDLRRPTDPPRLSAARRRRRRSSSRCARRRPSRRSARARGSRSSRGAAWPPARWRTRIAWPSAMAASMATPAAAESGFALNVPACAIFVRRFSSGSALVARIAHARLRGPTTAPPGSPPERILASVVRSGVMPSASCAPPGATRKPVTTSSKISSAPARRVSSRSAATNDGGARHRAEVRARRLEDHRRDVAGGQTRAHGVDVVRREHG